MQHMFSNPMHARLLFKALLIDYYLYIVTSWMLSSSLFWYIDYLNTNGIIDQYTYFYLMRDKYRHLYNNKTVLCVDGESVTNNYSTKHKKDRYRIETISRTICRYAFKKILSNLELYLTTTKL